LHRCNDKMNYVTKIPKKLHYFWFGGGEKNELIQKCLLSWQEHLPEYEIIEWNEANYDVQKNPITARAFADKKWAFLSDYARLDVLYEYGGVYLDTDIEIVKSLDIFMNHGVFLGMESKEHANASILGSIPEHWFIKEVLDSYQADQEYTTIPIKVTRVLKRYISIEDTYSNFDDVAVYPHEYFYPFGFTEKFTTECLTENTHAIHWWDHSWGSKKAKWLKRFGLLNLAQSFMNKLS